MLRLAENVDGFVGSHHVNTMLSHQVQTQLTNIDTPISKAQMCCLILAALIVSNDSPFICMSYIWKSNKNEALQE